MPIFEDSIHDHFDARIQTLGKVKARSVGADSLTLAALNVLVYAQLEGGVKDLASCVLRNVNIRRMPLGDIKPELLQWRNPRAIDRFRSMVDFQMVAKPSPFAPMLVRQFKVRAIDRRHELNQMSWGAIKQIYSGFGLDHTNIDKSRAEIDQLVDDRNSVAHHGVLPTIAATLMEKHIRDNVMIVENVLTDFSIQLLPFFTNRLHMR
jgi:hypothetical protein